MRSPVFLSTTAPFSAQVATFLRKDRAGTPVDLGDTLVIVPTAGAGRAIRRALAEQAGGVLAPAFKLPMQALLADSDDLASPLERKAAWVRALQETRREKFAALVPTAVKLSRPRDWLGVASRLMAVCDTLAEGGFHPGSPELAEHARHDAQRWKELAVLHTKQAEILGENDRQDPNALRIKAADTGAVPHGITRVVVALVPDLPAIASRWLENISAKSVSVDVLAWTCGENDARFDDWGRPDPEWWLTHTVRVPEEIILAENDSALEAEALVDFAAQGGPEAFAIVSADADSTAALAAEISARGSTAYLPEGTPLGKTEAATVLAGWDEFARGYRIQDLRPLLQLPAFLEYLESTTGFPANHAVGACDVLIASKLCRNLDAAREWAAENKADRDEDEWPRKLVAALEKLTGKRVTGRELAAQIYSSKETDEKTAGELETLVDAIDESAPILAGFSPEWREELVLEIVSQSRVFHPAQEGAVEISGWLEAPWTSVSLLCVAGCREGALPAGATEDAFLPDNLRGKLGLTDNAARYARDAYLLSCLLHRFGPEKLRLGYSRFRSGGEPNRPSRFLLGCADEELPERVEKVFQPSPARRRSSLRPVEWKLSLDAPPRVESIRVTGFKHYLECPLRFYLSQVEGLQSFDPEASEIGAADYGTLLHRVVENLHKRGPADSDDERVIGDFLEKELERVAARRYGRNPAPVVRVQIESMRQRVRHLAPLQAAERRAGWKIIETEYAVKKDAGLTVGPLALTGTMDRVEVHPEHGLRILDYKTFANAKTPEETHFGRPRAEGEFPETGIARKNKAGRQVRKSWADLQLPLYRHMATSLWPKYGREKIQAGYILLPGDPDDTQISMLQLEEIAQQGALRCAEAVAGRVAKGVFWPPASEKDYDDFGAWFGGESPGEVFDDATIAHLGGNP